MVIGLTAEPGNNEVRLTWTPDREFATPTGYAVLVSVVGQLDRVVEVDGPVTGTTLTGLRNGVEAAFTVYALTDAGSSEPSDTVSATPITGMEGEVAGLIVAFEPGVTVSDGQTDVPGEDQITTVGLIAAGKVSSEATLVELTEAVTLDQAEQMATQLEADPQVAWAEPDRFLFTAGDGAANDLVQTVAVPDDADYATGQWSLWDTYGIGVGDGATSMTNAWSTGTGEGATVAVIDTGITAHPDLDSQIVPGYDFVSNPDELAAARTERGPPEAFDADATDTNTFGASGWDANPTDPGDWRGVAPVRDSTWHGTKVAGVIAAQARNGQGIAGIAPDAKIQPIRALSWRGGLLSDIAASITWASGGTVDGVPANEHPSDVINLSLSAQTLCPTALQKAIDGARSRGSVIVAAAGNANDDASNYTPGNCNGVITVAATGRSGMRAPYSNYGPRIDISAPGGDIPVDGGITTTSNDGATTAGSAIWSAEQGTSMAAAHVSAAVAILAAKNRSLTSDDVEQALTGSVREFASTTCDVNLDYACGSGILSLAQVAAACTPTSSTYSSGSTTYRVLQFTTPGECTWKTPPSGTTMDVLIVGGGGAGGGNIVGGGGAGRVLKKTGLTAPEGYLHTIVVGDGGTGSAVFGATGESSNFSGWVAPGGGGGGSLYSGTGRPGGSGGGGACGAVAWIAAGEALAGTSTPNGEGSGNGGGSGYNGGGKECVTGGGGGAAGPGGAANGTSQSGGNGGNGLADSITGTSVRYGAGGGGGVNGASGWSNGEPGTGGAGGGGAGGAKYPASQKGNPGASGTGSGGGGASNTGSDAGGGGSGGSGIVIVSYALSSAPSMAIKSGDGQSAVVNTAVTTAPSVVVTGADGLPLQDTSVTFAVATGGGSLGSSATVTTDGSGIATAPTWTLGQTAGANTNSLTATASGVTNSPITITANSTPGAGSLAKSTITAGASSITGNGTSTSAITVQLKDQYGNNLTASGGTVTLATTLGSISAVTDNGNGTYSATLTSSTSTGIASISGKLAGSDLTSTTSVSFTAWTATKLVITQQPVAGASGLSLTTQPKIAIADSAGNTVTTSSASVSVTASGGTLGGTSLVTASSGVATFSGLTFSGLKTSSYTLTFASTGLTSATASITPSAAGSATAIAVNAGNGQSSVAGASVATAPSVLVTDGAGNPVSGTSVTFAVASGGGSLASSGTVTTNGAGIATSPAWTLGTTAGSNTLTATSGALSGSPATFTATGTPGTATKLVISGSATQTAGATQNLTITAKDENGNTATTYTGDKPLTFSGATAAGVVMPSVRDKSGTTVVFGSATTITFTNGVASVAVGKNGVMTLVKAESATVSVTDGTISSAGTDRLTVTVSAGDVFSIDASVSATSVVAGDAVTVSAQLRDQYENPVLTSGTTINWSKDATVGTLTSSSVTSSGVATATLTSSTTSGVATLVTATSGSLTGTAPTVTTIAGVADAANSTLSPAAVSITANGTATTVLTVTAKDVNGNTTTNMGTLVLSDVVVSKSTGTGSIGAVSGSNGVYTATVTAPTTTGQGVFVASLGGAAVKGGGASQSQATVDYVAGTATKYLVTVSNTSPTVGGSVTLSAQLSDANGNAVANSGRVVTWSTTAAVGQSFSSATSTTDASGIATVTFTASTVSATVRTVTATDASSYTGTSPTITTQVGAAAKFVVSSIAGQTAGRAFSVTAVLTDTYGNAVNNAGATGTVTLSRATGTGTLGGTLTGTIAVGASTVTISGVTYTKAESGVVLTATGSGAGSSMVGLTGDSNAFEVAPGEAAKLGFTTQPASSIVAGTSFAPVVAVQDANGNTVTSDSGRSITVALTGTGTLSGTKTVTTSGGLATFSGLSVDVAGTGKTLGGSSSQLTSATSSAFAITPAAGSAANSTISASSASITANGLSTSSITVRLVDAYGNNLTAGGATITIAATRGTVGSVFDNHDGTYTASLTSSTSAGAATVSATVGGATLAATTTVTFAAGTAHDMSVVSGSGQSATVGTAVANAVTVKVVDVNNNPVPNEPVTFAVTAGSGSLTTTSATTNASGVATLPADSWTLGTTVGANAVQASVTGGIMASITATGTPASVSKFEVTASGGTTALSSQAFTAGVASDVRVTAQDQYGNTNTTWTGTVSLTSTAASGTVSAVIASGGYVDSVPFTPTIAGGGKTISASATGVSASVASSTFTVQPGSLASFAVTMSDCTTALSATRKTAGTAFGVCVTAYDAYANVKTAWTGTVDLTSSAWSGTVSATNFTNGVSTSASLTPTVAGSGFAVHAASGAVVTSSASSTFEVDATTPDALNVVTAPVSTIAGQALSTQPTVEIVDSYGNRTTSSADVTVAASGGTLTGTQTVAAVNGLATFTNLVFDGGVGTSYTLTFSSGSLTDDTATISPSAAGNAGGLRFSVQPPASTVAGASFGATVRVVDASNNTVTTGADASRIITLSVSSGVLGCATGGTGCLSVQASSGVAVFTGLRMTSVGSGRQLSAAATLTAGAAIIASDVFAITPAAEQVIVLADSGSGNLVSGASRTFTATIQDQFGNTVDSSASVVFETTGTGSLSGLGSVAASHGVASVTAAGARAGSISLTAVASTLSLTSNAITFSVTPGAVVALDLAVSSNDLSAGATKDATVTLRDAYGNTAISASNTVTLGKDFGSGSVTGLASKAAISGVATFTLTGDQAGVIGLIASATVEGTLLVSGTYGFFVVPGDVASILLVADTGDLTASDHRTANATLKDAKGNVVTGSTDVVSFAQTGGTGSVTGLASATPVNGVASTTFDGKLAGSVEIMASIDGPVASNPISLTVVHGAVAGIVLTGSEADLASGSSRTFTATLQDVHGNTVSDATNAVTFSAYAGGGSVTGLTTVNAVAGVAQVSVTGAAAGLVEIEAQVTISGSPAATYASNDRDFSVVPGTAARLSLVGDATNLTAGATRTLTATVLDAYGNTVTSATNSVTFSQSSGAGAVSGTGASDALSGVASKTLTGTTAGSVSIVASSSGLTSSSPLTFTVDPGAATALSITTQPAGAVHGAALTTQPVVRLLDAYDNPLSSSGTVVTAATVSGTGTLTGTTATTNGSGIAAFSDLTLSGSYGQYALTFTAPGLAAATSSTFALAKADQTITFESLPDLTYGAAPFVVAATSDSGLTVSFTASPASVCTASGTNGSVISITGAGTCTVTAAQSGDGSYNPAPSVPRAFAVAKATQAAVSIDSASTVVYGSTLTLRASGGSGTGTLSYAVSGSSTCTVTQSGSMWTLHPGDAASVCEVTATRAGDGNYNARSSAVQTVTITKAAQTISFSSNVPMTPVSNDTYTPTAYAKASGTGTNSGLQVTFMIAPTSSAICAIDGSDLVTFTATGACVILANQSGDANRSAAPQARQTVMVGAINQSIAFPQPEDRGYGSASVSMTASASSGLDVTYALGAGTTNGACSVSILGAVSIQDLGVCEVVASQVGNAQFAAASDVTRAFTVVPALPTAPHITSISASDQAITLAYTEPGFTGGVPISAYLVTASPVGGGAPITTSSCSPTAAPLACTVTGLVNGTAYAVSVAAINSAGTGPEATASTSLTPATAAFAVTGLIAQPGDTTLVVTWTPLTQAQLGGGTFVRYAISYRPAASSGAFTACAVDTCAGAATTSQGTSTTTVLGLDNGTSYEVKIVALTTANGTAIDGNTATVTEYPSTAPSAPLTPTVLALSATDIQFSWADPLSDGGSALTNPPFTVTVTSATGATVTCTPTGADRHCHASGLTNGAVYTFEVVATNRMGSGPAATTTYAVPSSDATLSDLVISAGTLTPAFTALGTAYTTAVGNDVQALTVTPTTAMPGSTLTINGAAAISGQMSDPISLRVGETAITIKVTASDPRHTTTYTLTVTRAPAPTPPAPPASDPERQRPVIVPITELPIAPVSVTNSLVLVDGVPVATQVTSRRADSELDLQGPDFRMQVSIRDSLGVPTGSVSPTGLVAPVGSRIDVAATGYAADTDVRAYLVPRIDLTQRIGFRSRSSTSVVVLGDVTASAAGDISSQFTIPPELNAGDYLLQINGITPSSEVRSANISLLVTDVAIKPAAPRKMSDVAACSFQDSSIELSAACRTSLRTMAQGMPTNASNVRIELTGVAYGQGSEAANKALALKRAAAMRAYVVDQLQGVGLKSKIGVKIATVTHQGLPAGLSYAPAPVVSSADGSPATTVVVSWLVPAGT